jgi:hypothetical protein
MSSWTVWCIWFIGISSGVELIYKGYKYYQEVKKDKEIELESEKKISNKGI